MIKSNENICFQTDILKKYKLLLIQLLILKFEFGKLCSITGTLVCLNLQTNRYLLFLQHFLETNLKQQECDTLFPYFCDTSSKYLFSIYTLHTWIEMRKNFLRNEKPEHFFILSGVEHSEVKSRKTLTLKLIRIDDLDFKRISNHIAVFFISSYNWQ